MPKSVQMLFGLAEIKILAQQWAIVSIITKPPDVVFTIDDLTKLGPLMGKGVGGAGSSASPTKKPSTSASPQTTWSRRP